MMQRRFFEFGSGSLDKIHRQMSDAAYLLIWVGIFLAVLLVIMDA